MPFLHGFQMNTSVDTNVWGRILHSLKGRLNQQTLDTWFSPIQFESLDSSQHVIHLRAPNQVVKDWVVSNYSKVLTESLDELRLSGYSVGWVVGKVPEWVPPSNSVCAPGGESAAGNGNGTAVVTVREHCCSAAI